MWMRNDGNDPINAIQNCFTAYLTTAIKRQKYQYIKKRKKQLTWESKVDPIEHPDLWPMEIDVLAGLPPLAQIENQRLLHALIDLTERERYVLLAHVLDERSFSELAAELGLRYKGAAAIYYRAVQKIKAGLRGGVK